ncbi:mCG147739 [Mus musculus]|nr:mCG147739 [Mus musculus]
MTSLSRRQPCVHVLLQLSCDWFLEDNILILQNYNDLGFVI